MTDPSDDRVVLVPTALVLDASISGSARLLFASLRANDDDWEAAAHHDDDVDLLSELDEAGWVDVEVLPSGALSVTTRNDAR